MYIQAVFPIDYLAPTTQRDFSTLHLVEHLMIESLRKDKNFYDRDSSAQEMDTYGHILSATISRNCIKFDLEYLPSFETEALELLDRVINSSSYRLDFIEGIKEDLIDELRADSYFITLNDIFCKQNFDSFHRLRSGGSIRTIKNITRKDVEYWISSIQQAPYYLINSDGKVEQHRFKNPIAAPTIFNKQLESFQFVELKKISTIALFYTTSEQIEQSFIYAFEKYLRDTFSNYDTDINAHWFVMRGLNKLGVTFDKNTVDKNLILEAFKSFLEIKPQEYIKFGKTKHSEELKVSSVIRVHQIRNGLLYCS
jgi:hypothetical protein